MSSVWAMFAVVFLALYTANLAAFMIPRKEFHDFKGIDDVRISNPHSQKPMLKFSTIPYSYSDVTLQLHHPTMHNHMRRFNYVYNTTKKAIKGVKDGSLDAFIYDGMVLNYIASQDEECRLLQVGSWSAMTGYAIAFPPHSKYKPMFNAKILELRENGDLERLSRYWMSGMCKPNEQEKRASEPLTVSQFLSAFFLLGIGTLISVVLLIFEHIYINYCQDSLKHRPRTAQLCSLVSLSVADRFAVAPAAKTIKTIKHEFPSRSTMSTGGGGSPVKSSSPFGHYWHHSCGRRECSTTLHQLEEELEDALLQITQLEDQIREVEGGEGVDPSDSEDGPMLAMAGGEEPLSDNTQADLADRDSPEDLSDRRSDDDLEGLEQADSDGTNGNNTSQISYSRQIAEKETVL
eukprot:maker-scaffold452_size166894-snap-gene-0.47 protein:Tk11717 transcript:maker-scaffold452_size166894-snap-gene-0.47-mRNA-1 annotation:"Glutamate"